MFKLNLTLRQWAGKTSCKFRGQMQNFICKKWAPVLKPHYVQFVVIIFKT